MMSNEHRELLVQVETVLETIGDIEINFEQPTLDDVKAYLSEHGLVAVPLEPPDYALDILKRVRDGALGNCLAYRMIAAQGECNDTSKI
jgi:hypothetical protein